MSARGDYPGAGGKPRASEILTWARQREMQARDEARLDAEYAQLLYHQIKNTGWLPGGVDKLISARRLRKPLLKAAEANQLRAAFWRTFRATWLRLFGDPSAQRKQGVDFTS